MNMIETLRIINKSGGNIFSSETHKYIIPLYQREYAWGEKQIVRLIEDISDAENVNKDAENEKKYYIGTLIVSKRNDGKLEVIDGQQRLTTLFLLLNCLGVTTKTHLTFECRDRSNYTLENIQEKNDLDEKQQEDNIVKGVEIIKRTLEKEKKSNPKFIDDLKEKLKKVILFQIIVPEHTDLNRYFEIMNTRGEQLAQHDILKAHLMKGLTPDERARFARIWDACSDMDGYVQMHFSPNRIETLSREKLFGGDWNKMPKDEIIWPLQNSPSTPQNGNRQEAENNWTIGEILKQSEVQASTEFESKEERTRFESIIDFPHFLLHTLKVYIHKKKIKVDIGRQLDDKKLIENFKKVETLRNKVPPMYNMYKLSFAREFIICLLQTRFAFDQYIIKREYTSKNEDEDGEWSLKTLYASNSQTTYYKNSTFIGKGSRNQEFVNKDLCKENLMIQSALRVSYTSPKEMHWITELLIDLCVNKEVTTYQDYPNHIKGGMGNDILTSTEQIAATAVKNFIDKNITDDTWKKSGTATQHILFNYLDYLLWKQDYQKDQKFKDFTFEFRNSVEHWYPQNPSAEGFAKWDDIQDDTTVNRLGNLCLIQRNVNSRFSNSSPVSKLNSFKGIVEKGSLKLRLMSEKTTGDKEWRTTACEEHEKAMIKILKDDLTSKSLI